VELNSGIVAKSLTYHLIRRVCIDSSGYYNVSQEQVITSHSELVDEFISTRDVQKRIDRGHEVMQLVSSISGFI